MLMIKDVIERLMKSQTLGEKFTGLLVESIVVHWERGSQKFCASRMFLFYIININSS